MPSSGIITAVVILRRLYLIVDDVACEEMLSSLRCMIFRMNTMF